MIAALLPVLLALSAPAPAPVPDHDGPVQLPAVEAVDMEDDVVRVPTHLAQMGRDEARFIADNIADIPTFPLVARPQQHHWCVLLTATVKPFINLRHFPWGKKQQVDAGARRHMYEEVLRDWATKTSMPIIFAENSQADLTSLKSKIPPVRRQTVEFITTPIITEHTEEIGQHEAFSILMATKTSNLLQKCSNVLKVTGRFFIKDVQKALGTCPFGTAIAVQNPSWQPGLVQMGGQEVVRQETQVLGFKKEYAHQLFSWSTRGEEEKCMECHITSLVDTMKNDANYRSKICNLPSMEVKPTREGTTGKLRTTI